MAVMDEFREERVAIKKAPLKAKISYVWHYYKWHITIPLLIIIFLSWYIVHTIAEPDIILDGAFLNTRNSQATSLCNELRDEFIKGEKIDTKKYDITFDASLLYEGGNNSDTNDLETTQLLTLWITSGKSDFLIGDWSSVANWGYKSYLMDLREVLSEEQIKQYEPYFLYVDNAKCQDIDADLSNVPACDKPEEMEDPIPVLIDVSNYPRLSKIYAREEALALGICAKSSHVDNVLKLLNYLE